MRILIVSHSAGSPRHGMLFRPYYLCREFAARGHETTIVAASFFHTRHQNPSVSSDLQDESVDGVRYIWLKTFRYSKAGAVRAMGMIWFALKLLWYSRALRDRCRPAVVIATSPDPLIVFGALRIAKLSGAKFVFEFRDIWPLTLTELGEIPAWHPFIVLLRLAERHALRKADLVVSVLERADLYLKEIGLTPRRLLVIPNGISPAERDGAAAGPLSRTSASIGELRARYPFLLGYAGHHGIATALPPLIEAMASLRADRIALVLIGDGPDKAPLAARARELGLDNVLFLDPVPRDQLLHALSLVDACYVGSRPTRLYRFGLSINKVFDYMVAGKPIVSALCAESDPVVHAGCGIKALGQSCEDIADAIRAMSRLTGAERLALGRNGHAFVLREHDYAKLAARYLAPLEDLTAPASGS